MTHADIMIRTSDFFSQANNFLVYFGHLPVIIKSNPLAHTVTLRMDVNYIVKLTEHQACSFQNDTT